MNYRSSKTIIVALVAGLLASIIGFGGPRLAAPAAAQSRAPRIDQQWEYGELTILGNNAVFWVEGQPIYMEGPAKREPQLAQGSRSLSVIQPARLIHLNALGAGGWEIVYPVATQDGETFLLKRRI